MKLKFKKSFIHLTRNNELEIYQYERLPIKPFISGRLRSSFFNLSLSENELTLIINSMMKSIIENKSFSLNIGYNPYEVFIFSNTELKPLIIDFIIARKYIILQKDKDKFKKEFMKNNKLDDFDLTKYEYLLDNISLHSEILKRRKYELDLTKETGQFFYIEIEAKKEYEKLLKEVQLKLEKDKSKDKEDI